MPDKKKKKPININIDITVINGSKGSESKQTFYINPNMGYIETFKEFFKNRGMQLSGLLLGILFLFFIL